MNVHELARQVVDYKARCILTDYDVLGGLVQDADRGCDWVAGANNYTWWYAIGAVKHPRKIVEIGSRFGYSLKAIMMGAGRNQTVLYVIDDERDADREPLKILERHFKTWDAEYERVADLAIRREDSQKLVTLMPANCQMGVGFDLGSVDADHSMYGCYHDCGLVWEILRPGGLMVVDDCQPGCVRDGCERFCRDMGVEWAYLPSLRGIHLVLKP